MLFAALQYEHASNRFGRVCSTATSVCTTVSVYFQGSVGVTVIRIPRYVPSPAEVSATPIDRYVVPPCHPVRRAFLREGLKAAIVCRHSPRSRMADFHGCESVCRSGPVCRGCPVIARPGKAYGAAMKKRKRARTPSRRIVLEQARNTSAAQQRAPRCCHEGFRTKRPAERAKSSQASHAILIMSHIHSNRPGMPPSARSAQVVVHVLVNPVGIVAAPRFVAPRLRRFSDQPEPGLSPISRREVRPLDPVLLLGIVGVPAPRKRWPESGR